MSIILKGVMQSTVTPLKEDFSPDLPTFERLLEFHVRTGATAISWPHHKAESLNLTIAERKAFAEVAVKVVARGGYRCRSTSAHSPWRIRWSWRGTRRRSGPMPSSRLRRTSGIRLPKPSTITSSGSALRSICRSSRTTPPVICRASSLPATSPGASSSGCPT